MTKRRVTQSELQFAPRLDPTAMITAAGEATRLLKAIGNESRLIILCRLSQGECSVSDLRDVLPLTQSALSQHLARLRKEGLVYNRRESRNIFYSLAPGPAEGLLEALFMIYCGSRKA
jgi:DNA-binding transcriptional ArsR family regulator